MSEQNETPLPTDLPDTVLPDTDVDLALSAIASLQELTQEPEPDEATADETTPDGADDSAPVAELEPMPTFIVPPLTFLERGQAASVVPSIALMGVGIALTVLLVTSETVITSGLLIAMGLGLMGLTTLAYWYSSGRWSVGNFFIGITLLAWTGLLVASETALAPLMRLLPLAISAIGLSLILTTWFTPVQGRRLGAMGGLLVIIGVVWFVVS